MLHQACGDAAALQARAQVQWRAAASAKLSLQAQLAWLQAGRPQRVSDMCAALRQLAQAHAAQLRGCGLVRPHNRWAIRVGTCEAQQRGKQ